MKTFILLFVLSTIYIFVFAGEASGTVLNSQSKKPVESGSVTIFNSGYKRSTQIQLNGDYSFGGLSAGTYTIAALSEGMKDTITGVVVNNEGATNVDLHVGAIANLIGEVNVVVKTKYKNKLIDPYELHPELVTTEKEISHMGHIDVATIVSVNSGVQVNENNEISIRGSRPTATRIMIDGVYSQLTVPSTAIRYVRVYSGGIPAKYGDTSGGIILLETKSYFDNN